MQRDRDGARARTKARRWLARPASPLSLLALPVAVVAVAFSDLEAVPTFVLAFVVFTAIWILGQWVASRRNKGVPVDLEHDS